MTSSGLIPLVYDFSETSFPDIFRFSFGRHFNDRAVYTCDDGYQIVGLEQVICNSDGAWSGNQPSCKQASSNAQSRYYCGEPKHIQNAKHNGSKEQVSSKLSPHFNWAESSVYERTFTPLYSRRKSQRVQRTGDLKKLSQYFNWAESSVYESTFYY
jgi:hypothetical protein